MQCWGFPGGSEVKESACDAGDLGWNPGTGSSRGEGHGNLLQYSCLENPMDKGAWQATVTGVAESQHNWEANTFTFFHAVLEVRGAWNNIYKHWKLSPEDPSQDLCVREKDFVTIQENHGVCNSFAYQGKYLRKRSLIT